LSAHRTDGGHRGLAAHLSSPLLGGFLVELTLDEGVQVPVVRGLQFVDLLQLDEGVSVYELREAHEAAAYSDDQFVVENLGKDFLGAEEVETIAQAANRNTNFHRVDVLSQQLIDDITLHGLVNVLQLLVAVGIVEDGCLLPEGLLEAFNDDFLVTEYVFESLQVSLLLLENLSELIALVLQLLNVPLETLVVSLLVQEVSLELFDDGSLLLDLQDADINFVAELDYLLLVLHDLEVAVYHDQGLRVHLLEQRRFVVETQLVLGHLLLDGLFQVLELLVADFGGLLTEDGFDFVLEGFNFCLLLLNFLDEIADGEEVAVGLAGRVQQSGVVGLFDLQLDLLDLLLDEVGPPRVRCVNGFLNLTALETTLLDVLLQVSDLLRVVARVVEGGHARANSNLVVESIGLRLEFAQFLLGVR